MGDDQVERYLKEEGIPLLLEIPFARRIAEGYARGQSLLEVKPELKPDFRELLREITTMVPPEQRGADVLH
jgi:MinD superfamily P-loop ATPase